MWDDSRTSDATHYSHSSVYTIKWIHLTTRKKAKKSGVMFECCCLFQNNKQGTHDIEQNVYEKKKWDSFLCTIYGEFDISNVEKTV